MIKSDKKDFTRNGLDPVREYIIGLLTGGHPADTALPSAREISKMSGVSYLTALKSISSLSNDGVLSILPRKGIFAREEWRTRALNETVLTDFDFYPWFDEFRCVFGRQAPFVSIRTKRDFHAGAFEIIPTADAQTNHERYADLSTCIGDIAKDSALFFTKAFDAGRVGSRLIGIPVIFSPRVIIYNPGFLKKHGCPLPFSGWRFDDFIGMIKLLGKKLPPEKIFNWNRGVNIWMSVVFRAGGALLTEMSPEGVKIDSPETRKGLSVWREIRDALGAAPSAEPSMLGYWDLFCRGEAAFTVSARQMTGYMMSRNFDGWDSAPLPLINGEAGKTVQATDLLCVRKDRALSKDCVSKVIAAALSEETQDFLGSRKYGVPIRKSSAMKSVNVFESRDSVFLSEIAGMTGRYYLSNPLLSKIVLAGIDKIWDENADVDSTCSELAQAVRTLIKIGIFQDERQSV